MVQELQIGGTSDLEPTIFSAVITPHRSLPRIGFLLLMAAFGAVSFIAGMLFMLAGAWPVFGLFGLDVLLLYWTLRLNYRHAGAYEEVKVTASALTVRKVSHRGQAPMGAQSALGQARQGRA